MKELSFEERVLITEQYARQLLEHPNKALNLPIKAIEFFELNFVKFHDIQIPQCSLWFFEYFSSVLKDNPNLNSKNISLFLIQLNEEYVKIPDVNRPKNEMELESKIKKLSGWFLARVLTELAIADLEKKTVTDEDFIKYLVLVGIEFSMTMKEIMRSYHYNINGHLPFQYLRRLDHSKRYLRTYLCIRCGQIFFNKSNNAKYCPDCSHKKRIDDQRNRRNKRQTYKPTRCLFCHKTLTENKTKPRKYCNDDCRYAARKKKN